jgi:cellulose synthase/poly-beta-1,6-N-acetylglucosamine synthase-like glycosyltransferase
LVSSIAGAATLLGWLEGIVLAVYVLAQILLVLYSSHRYVVLWRWWRTRRSRALRTPESGTPPAVPPRVTVQLPIYNERAVVERLIAASAALRYPLERLEIQVLDDSTDDTTALAAREIARHRRRGVDIHHVRRATRAGFKPGALAHGMRQTHGELIAVFDADFVPAPDFLERIVPAFQDPAVGMVQARWGHLNRDRSLLTVAQATMLDAHFLLEHETRQAAGLFFNFNGTAGVWRRACIEDSGGWSDDTLTEDLDLSYRAQLKGWRFRYASDVVVPAELPADIGALQSQQRRWAKGSIQTARKLLSSILRLAVARRLRVEAFIHLTANVAYPLLLTLGVLLLPVLLGAPQARPWVIWAAQVGVWCFGVVPTLMFLAVGQRLGGAGWWRTVCHVVAAVVLSVGLSLNNARAVMEGLGGPVGPWERTPKTGDRGGREAPERPYRPRPGLAGAAESGLAVYFLVAAVLAPRGRYEHAVPFLLLLALGFACVAVATMASRRTRVIV